MEQLWETGASIIAVPFWVHYMHQPCIAALLLIMRVWEKKSRSVRKEILGVLGMAYWLFATNIRYLIYSCFSRDPMHMSDWANRWANTGIGIGNIGISALFSVPVSAISAYKQNYSIGPSLLDIFTFKLPLQNRIFQVHLHGLGSYCPVFPHRSRKHET